MSPFLRRIKRAVLGAPKKMDDRARLHEFWRTPEPDGNVPSGYLGPIHRSRALVGLIRDVPKTSSILEVGCNIGRNLNHLWSVGYHSLAGIEISPHAVEQLRVAHPDLATIPVHLGPAEEHLPKFSDAQFDLVFTMAVIEHIHPDSASLFGEMARCGRSILAIEPRGNASHRQYPHDVPAIFRGLGMKLVSTVPMKDLPETAGDPAISKYVAWRFEH